MRSRLKLLVSCGQGLEPACVQEISTLFPALQATPGYGRRSGFVEVNSTDEATFFEDVAGVPSSIHCQEKIYVAVHEKEMQWHLFTTKDILERKLEDFFDETFKKLANPVLNGKLAGMVNPSETSITCVEIATLLPKALAERHLTQSQLQAIGNRKAKSRGIEMILKQKDVPRLLVRAFGDILVALLQLPVRPGNLPLTKVHPTGLFPSFAFAMLQEAFELLSVSQVWQRGEAVHVVDPMCGAGTIPLMAWTAREYLGQMVDVEPGSLLVSGIDTDEVFLAMATENASALGAGESVSFMSSDFSPVNLDSPADAIVCQPPYGYSIAIPDASLESMHADLFDWAARNTRAGGVIIVISPRKDIISRVVQQDTWLLVRSSRVRQHSLECKIYAYRRLDTP
jgi:predicted RNA methylase